jgi:hypothetical protein
MLRTGRIEKPGIRGQKPLAIDSPVDESAQFTRCHLVFALNADDQESSACSVALPDSVSPISTAALLNDGLVLSLLCVITERPLIFVLFGITWHGSNSTFGGHIYLARTAPSHLPPKCRSAADPANWGSVQPVIRMQWVLAFGITRTSRNRPPAALHTWPERP